MQNKNTKSDKTFDEDKKNISREIIVNEDKSITEPIKGELSSITDKQIEIQPSRELTAKERLLMRVENAKLTEDSKESSESEKHSIQNQQIQMENQSQPQGQGATPVQSQTAEQLKVSVQPQPSAQQQPVQQQPVQQQPEQQQPAQPQAPVQQQPVQSQAPVQSQQPKPPVQPQAPVQQQPVQQQPVQQQPAQQQPVQSQAPVQPQPSAQQQPVQQQPVQQQPEQQQPVQQQPVQQQPVQQQPVQQQPVQQQPQAPVQSQQPTQSQPQNILQANYAKNAPQQNPHPTSPQQNPQPAPPQQNPHPAQPQQNLRTTSAPQKLRPTPAQPNPKRLIYGCSGCSGVGLIIFVIFVLVFVGQTTSGGENPLAKTLGVSTASFINVLSSLVNMIFGSITILLFILAVVGVFRVAMARKDDKETKKKGLTLAGVSSLFMLIIVAMWVGIYIYLTSNKLPLESAPIKGFITEPEQTLLLTAPITIRFDASKLPINTAKYQILSYRWDFDDDGAVATSSTTSYTYEKTGTYESKLDVTVRNISTGEDTISTFTKTISISDVTIKADFKAIPEKGPAPLTVKFDATDSNAPAGRIISYDWDFNNDNKFDDAEGVEVTHTFEREGKYKINLRVTDNNNKYSIVSKEVTVEGPNIPIAQINIKTEDGNYYAGTQYVFEADKSSSPNGKITKWSWDFGDGSSKATTRTASHTYKTEGDFEVILFVTDEEGKTGEASQKIKVRKRESAPVAVIKTIPLPNDNEHFISGAVPFEVSFNAKDSTDADNNIVDYKWDFDGDGQIDGYGDTITYIYKVPGVYIATLTVLDAENNESKSSIEVKVGDQPITARISADPIEGVAPLTVTFDASSSTYAGGEIVSYEWDFGDGGPKKIDVSKVTYKYNEIGTFTVNVTAIASDNTKSTAQLTINVRPIPLTACFTATPESGPAPLTGIVFDPKCSTGTIAKHRWDFGDGTTSSQRKPEHDYMIAGSYTVTLEVTDNKNMIDTFKKNILVTGNL